MALGKSDPEPTNLIHALLAQEVLQSRALVCYSKGNRRMAYMYYLLDELADPISFSDYILTMMKAFPNLNHGIYWE